MNIGEEGEVIIVEPVKVPKTEPVPEKEPVPA